MWKWNPKDGNKPVESFYSEATHIGKSIVIKGEVSGSENVYVAYWKAMSSYSTAALRSGPKGVSAPTCKPAASWFTVEWTETCTASSALI